MFKNKDYKNFFKQLYEIEVDMKKEGQKLLKILKNDEAQKLLKVLISDETRHMKIVKEMIDLI